jgi:DNA polymerase III subunit alpha
MLADTINHIHVHGEDSALDGYNKVKDLVARAVEIGSTALGLTDHGVMSGIPDLITECKKAGIKPLPGCEAYMTKDRTVKGEQLEQMRKYLCLKYRITDSKGKPKMKVLSDFIRKVKKDFNAFEQEAPQVLKDYLMEAPADLFSISDFSETPEGKIEAFRNEILEYLDHDSYHLVLIAINNQGLEDLYEIVSDAHIHGFYGDPRTDLEFIRRKNLGKHIVATSACLGSYFAHLVRTNRIDKAKEFIQECKETFHTFYLEKQATLIPEQLELNAIIDQLAEETNTPKIVTTDVHFARREDHSIHDIMVAASLNKCIQDENRYHYAVDHYMKTVEEVREIVNDEEAIQNTLKLAEMVDVDLPKEPLFPKAIIEGDETPEELLRKKAWDGLFQYCLKRKDIDYNTYANRLQYELDVICSLGFSDYFLIDEDMINATKRAGFLVGPGRGSAAGSLVAFTTGITTLDPIENDLLFERFLNPERAGYPDIDVDYSYAGARWVQNYLKQKYGENKVAQIGTKGTLAAKAAIRLIGKTLGYDANIIDDFAKAIPNKPGIKLIEAYNQEERIKAYADHYKDWWEAALKLEGHVRSFGVHAGGIVLSPVPLTKVVPLRLDSEGLVTTQYDMSWIEKLLVKFDILKLDTLDLIKKTLEYAGLWGKFDIEDIDLNDPYVYEKVYNQLNLSGIFQCESDLFKNIISELKPNCFEDISVIVALGRPGPLDLIPSYIRRKWGLEKVTYPFPELEPVLKKTYGIWVK